MDPRSVTEQLRHMKLIMDEVANRLKEEEPTIISDDVVECYSDLMKRLKVIR
jgi:hypothetical protein